MLDNKNIKMINIIRDIRDVIVSRYYFDVSMNEVDNHTPFETYFENFAYKKISQYINYHYSWHKEAPEPLLVSYELLKTDFDEGASRIARYLELPVANKVIDNVKEKTSFKRKNEENSIFYRKGIVGDWKNHFNDVMCKKMKMWLVEAEYSVFLDNLHKRHDLVIPEELITGKWG